MANQGRPVRSAGHGFLDEGAAIAENPGDVVLARNVLPLTVGAVELIEQGAFRTPLGAVCKQSLDYDAIVL